MRVRPGRESGDFLMPDMQPLNAAMAPERIGEAVQAIAHDAIDASDTGGGEGFDHLVGNGHGHGHLPMSRQPSMSSGQ